MTTDKATPRPWRLDDSEKYYKRGTIRMNGVTTAQMIEMRTMKPGERDANAVLIVAAVNSYDAHRALYDRAQRLLAYIHTHELIGPDSIGQGDVAALDEALRAVDEAEKVQS